LAEIRDTRRAAWAAAFLFAALRLWYVGQIQLSPDEAYYWEWSRSLDWSYYDQGPGLALAIRLGTWVFGSIELGVRVMSVLSGLGVSLLAARLTAVELGRPRAALWVVLALNTMLLYSVGAVLMMHDSLMGFFWAWALAAGLRALKDPRWWLAAGLAGGLGILCKYTGVLVFAGVLLALATRPELRRHFRSPWLWAGAALGTLVGLGPILGWNAAHGWPSFQHVFSLAGGDSSRHSWVTFPEFLGSQLGLITPLLFLMIAQAWWINRRPDDAKRHFLLCLSAFPFAFFLLLSLKTRVEGNWPAQAYLAGVLLLALDLDLKSPAARWAIVVAALFAGAAHLQAARPFLPIPQERAKLDTASRADGWRELAAAVQAERASLPADAFVGCRTYQNAAELAFYLPGQPRPLIIQKGQINHQYRLWNRPAEFRGRDAVLVVGQEWEVNEMREAFASLEPRGLVEHRRNHIVTSTWRIYLGRGYRP
jgi:4-amino-4-deoxy-L-arabinose transferase-like glycosyltransferase